MPYVVTTSHKKEKLVSSLMNKQGLSPERAAFDGMLVCMQEVDPLFRDLPYVKDIIHISDEEAQRLISGKSPSEPDPLRSGSHVLVVRGDFQNCHGIIRCKNNDTLTVDISYLDRMIAVELPASDVEPQPQDAY